MIVTFYSYKPDVGCTMAGVNIAILLCEKFQKKALLVDWNFAAPKLLGWLGSASQPPVGTLIGLLNGYRSLIEGEQPISADQLPKCGEFVNPTTIPGLEFVPACGGTEIGEARLTSFDWEEFYRDYHGGGIVEHIRAQWTHTYDFVIVLSGKGISKVASVCTLHVPDVVVLMMSMNPQEIQASLQVARMIRTLGLQRDARKASILPVPSRVEFAEYSLLQELRQRVQESFSRYLPAGIDPSIYFPEIDIPNIPYYRYASEIAVLREDGNDPKSISRSYLALARYLVALAEV
jgi:MinD-like ATPase involved in chromosome partitioning or flagellar assembly